MKGLPEVQHQCNQLPTPWPTEVHPLACFHHHHIDHPPKSVYREKHKISERSKLKIYVTIECLTNGSAKKKKKNLQTRLNHSET